MIVSLVLLVSCRKDTDNFSVEYIPSISNEEFKIISPKSGEIWRIGETYEIKWVNSSRAKQVKIELYRKNVLRKVISNQTENDGSFFYSVPMNSEISSLFRIKISNYDDPQEFVFSEYFSIR
ncbi:MAG: GPI anchored serine-threonine rich family protein [Ignavibacteria bacterium]|nr:GPI anchored serine-threonine rich family protein [Ignavibacteria bacterium]